MATELITKVGAVGTLAQVQTNADGSTSLLGQDRSALLTFDASGNIVANVNHRKGALATLLNITNAGDGEIALATDVDAIVVYHGSPSVGEVYGRTDQVGYSRVLGSFISIPDITTTVLPFQSSNQEHSSTTFSALFDVANKWFIAPAATVATHVRIDASLMYSAAFAAGTHKIALQYDSSAGGDGSVWTDVAVNGEYAYAIHPAASSPRSSLVATIKIRNPGRKHRLVAYQSSGAAQTSVDASYAYTWLMR